MNLIIILFHFSIQGFFLSFSFRSWVTVCPIQRWRAARTMREVSDGSLSYLFVGIGFVVVGLPSIKCVEPTLES